MTRPAPVTVFRPSTSSLQKRVRSLAANENVVIARDLISELVRHEVSDLQVVQILKRAVVSADIQPSREEGGWLCIITDRQRWQKEVGSIFIEVSLGKLWVLKINWENVS